MRIYNLNEEQIFKYKVETLRTLSPLRFALFEIYLDWQIIKAWITGQLKH